jgi:hypothetical protein
MAKPKNNYTVDYGTNDGDIKFGHVHEDGEISSVMLRGKSPEHYITLEQTGKPHRKSGTICRSRGSFQIQAGDDVQPKSPGIYLEAVSGDICIIAPSGRIRMIAENIDLLASGADGENGVIILDANEKVIIKAPTIDISSVVSTKIFSEKTVEVIGNGVLNIYGGLIEFVEGTTQIKGSKNGPIPGLGTLTEIKRALQSIAETLS